MLRWLARLVATATFGVASLSFASSKDSDGFVTVELPNGFLDIGGICQELVVIGQPHRACNSEMVVDFYQGSDMSIVFGYGAETVIFRGDVTSAPGAPETVLSVKGLTIGHTRGSATGSCRFGDPFKGVASFDCRARGDAGEAQGRFISNGRMPAVFHV